MNSKSNANAGGQQRVPCMHSARSTHAFHTLHAFHARVPHVPHMRSARSARSAHAFHTFHACVLHAPRTCSSRSMHAFRTFHACIPHTPHMRFTRSARSAHAFHFCLYTCTLTLPYIDMMSYMASVIPTTKLPNTALSSHTLVRNLLHYNDLSLIHI